MTQIEQIKAEIERRMKKNQQDATESGAGAFYEDRELLSFINSLPAEQPSEDLEEAANIYANKQGLELKPFAIKFFKSGAQWQKEQMMKSAIEGCWIKRNRYTKENVLNGLSVTCDAIQKFRDGDTVKVIIVKEDK
jgi:hypothetical protein